MPIYYTSAVKTDINSYGIYCIMDGCITSTDINIPLYQSVGSDRVAIQCLERLQLLLLKWSKLVQRKGKVTPFPTCPVTRKARRLPSGLCDNNKETADVEGVLPRNTNVSDGAILQRLITTTVACDIISDYVPPMFTISTSRKRSIETGIEVILNEILTRSLELRREVMTVL
eukprot:Tbor_TRINITY_DN5681_c0_g1::TRINITY_DN5681_c0_g1_i1::g.8607::m.8607